MASSRLRVFALIALLAAVVPAFAPADATTTLPDRLFAGDFPDPSVLRAADGTYFAYWTNGRGSNVQVLRSADLRTWERLPDALPKLPAWAAPDFTWAPSVLARGGSGHVLYLTARHRTTGLQCIGRAVGTSPRGPFTDELAQPFVCQMDVRGSRA